MTDLLLSLLEEAINECYEKDKSLIDLGMEQASVARIFYYMQNLIATDDRFKGFQSYHLDNEYNKRKDARKDTLRRKFGTRPDLILHERGKQDKNLLIIEFKSCNGRMEKDDKYNEYIDYIKLEDFTNERGDYGYQLGVLLS